MTDNTNDRPKREALTDFIHCLADAMGVHAFTHLYLTCVMLVVIFFPDPEWRSFLWLGVCVSGVSAAAYTFAHQIDRSRKANNNGQP